MKFDGFGYDSSGLMLWLRQDVQVMVFYADAGLVLVFARFLTGLVLDHGLMVLMSFLVGLWH